METIDYNGVSLHRWTCGPSTFLARPEFGAYLMNWNLQMSDGTVRDVIHWPENADYSNFARVRGGNPILFPFAARSFHAGKIGYWPDQDGTVRPMPMHGFSRDSQFKITRIDETSFTAELQPSEVDHQAYPYEYRFTVRYEFAETSFKVFLNLENLDTKPILWCAGHHFYFSLPWHDESTRSDYSFKIPAKECYTQAPDGSLVAEPKGWQNETSFGNPKNTDRIYTQLKDQPIIFGPNNGDDALEIRILPETETASPENAIVIWTERPDSPFYCVEPWMGPPNSAEHGKGLHTVNSGERASFGVEVSLL